MAIFSATGLDEAPLSGGIPLELHKLEKAVGGLFGIKEAGGAGFFRVKADGDADLYKEKDGVEPYEAIKTAGFQAPALKVVERVVEGYPGDIGRKPDVPVWLLIGALAFGAWYFFVK